jgi:hypothetical protein
MEERRRKLREEKEGGEIISGQSPSQQSNHVLIFQKGSLKLR